MTYTIRLQLEINEIRAGRGVYGAMNLVSRLLLINDLIAGRKII